MPQYLRDNPNSLLLFFVIVLMPGYVVTAYAHETAAQKSTDNQVPPFKVMVVTGVGVDQDKATKNAFANAIENAVGTLVDAETIVNNESVVKDQILTYSDAYIDHYDKISEGKRDDGLWEVKIKAFVQPKKLEEKLRDSNITVAQVDGKSIAARLGTQSKKEQDGAALLMETIKRLEIPHSLLVARLVDKNPKVLKKDASKAQVCWFVELSYDVKKYDSVVVPELQKALRLAALASVDAPVADEGQRKESLTFEGIALLKNPTSSGNGRGPADLSDYVKKGAVLCLLNVGRDSNGIGQRYWCCAMDRDLAKRVLNSLDQYFPLVVVDFLDESGQSVRREEIDPSTLKMLNVCRTSFPGFADWLEGNGLPLTIRPKLYAHFSYVDACVLPIVEDLPLEELQRISQIKCSVIPSTKPK